MGSMTTTFATTTLLSVLLHGAVLVGWLAMAEQPSAATEQGLQVQLMSSYHQMNQAVTEKRFMPSMPKQLIPKHEVKTVQKKNTDKKK